MPTGCSITEAVTILGNKLRDYQGQFNTTHLLALCDYFYNTFICHYKLYQYVLGQEQDVNLTVMHLEVCAPPQPRPLAEGKDREIWKQEQQVAELSAAEVQKRTNMLLLKEELRLEQEHLRQETLSKLSLQRCQALKREVRWCPPAGRGGGFRWRTMAMTMVMWVSGKGKDFISPSPQISFRASHWLNPAKSQGQGSWLMQPLKVSLPGHRAGWRRTKSRSGWGGGGNGRTQRTDKGGNCTEIWSRQWDMTCRWPKPSPEPHSSATLPFLPGVRKSHQ